VTTPAWRFFAPPALLTLLGVVTFWPVLISHGLIGDRLSDSYRYMYFMTTAYRDSLLRGDWPLWNPSTYLGSPFLAKGNAGILYPFTSLVAVLPQAVAINWFVVAHLCLAGCLMYVCALQFALTPEAALLSSIVYMFNGFQMWTAYAAAVPMLACYAWTPAVVAAYADALTNESRRVLLSIVATTALAIVILSGYPQDAFYVVVALACYAVWAAWQSRWQRKAVRTAIGILGVMLIGAIGLSAVLLLPMYEASRLSTRQFAVGWDLAALRFSHEGSYNPLWLVTFVYPYIFGGTPRELAPAGTDWLSVALSEVHSGSYTAYLGVLPLALGAFAVIHGRRQKPLVIFLGSLTALAFLMALGGYTPVYRIFYWAIPVLRSFRIPARALFLVVFGLSVLTGIGFDSLATHGSGNDARDRRRWSTGLAILAGITLGGAALELAFKTSIVTAGVRILNYIYFDLGRAHRESYETWRAMLERAYWVSLRGFAMSAAALAGSAWLFWFCARSGVRRSYVLAASLVLVIADLGYYARGFAGTFDVARRLDEERAILRVSVADIDLHRVKLISSPGMPAVIDSNVFAAIGGFGADGYDGFVLDRYRRLSALVDRDLASGSPRLATLLNVKYVVSREPLALRDVEVIPDDAVRVYRLRHSLPRAFLAQHLRYVQEDDEALTVMARADFDPARDVVVQDVDLPTSVPEADSSSGRARVSELTANSMRLTVETARPALLVISDMHYPGWTASIDRTPAAIHRVDYAFRGVVVPQGVHDVTLKYEPASVKAGVAVSLTSIAVLAGFTLWVLAVPRHRR
jgi:membrane protein YfhO